ncbi:thyroglobulin type-1 repeat-containing protein [Myxococcus fulvus]|uniref:thyroglobulin type-1 repeat-containing protein n=1 Tax=Myxococcus fulvus TaxID=33 RepID=UPI003B9BA126
MFAPRTLILGLTTATLLLTTSAQASGPCAKAVEETADPPPMPGRFVPQCTDKGYYKLVQFHGSTGYSWCVNPSTGAKVEGTDVAPGKGTPTCPVCVEQLASSLEKTLVGAYSPQCSADGTFQKVQHNASTRMAWCADTKTGKKLTKPVRNDGKLTCR